MDWATWIVTVRIRFHDQISEKALEDFLIIIMLGLFGSNYMMMTTSLSFLFMNISWLCLTCWNRLILSIEFARNLRFLSKKLCFSCCMIDAANGHLYISEKWKEITFPYYLNLLYSCWQCFCSPCPSELMTWPVHVHSCLKLFVQGRSMYMSMISWPWTRKSMSIQSSIWQ